MGRPETPVIRPGNAVCGACAARRHGHGRWRPALPGVTFAALLRRNVSQTLLIHPHWPDAEPGESRRSEEGSPFRYNHALPGIGRRRRPAIFVRAPAGDGAVPLHPAGVVPLEANSPAGGVAWSYSFDPQQATEPSRFTPQVWNPPALTEANSPAGGVARP